MSTLLEKIDHQIATFLSTLKRFPLASFSALLITIIFVLLSEYRIASNTPDFVLASKIAFVSSLGLVLFPALQLLGRSVLFPLLGVAGLIVYFYLLPENLDEATQEVFTRHIFLFLALFLMIFWAPFVGRKSTNTLFWHYAQTVIFGLISALFFSLLLYGGLAIALYSIESLFDVTIESQRYLQLSMILFGIFGFNFFLSQIPKYPLFLETRAYSNAKRVFTKYILVPLTLLYFVILFAYSAKILLTLTWPEGTLAWIIVSFCLVAIVTFLFLTPYLQKSTKTQRLLWLAILLQTFMLGLALWVRVEAYGITHNRYLLALFGVWLLLMALYFILLGKWAQQKWLFFTASLLLVGSQFGSYSAYTIAQQDQTQRLIKLIETAHPRSEALATEKKYAISHAISYLHRHYGIEAFQSIIPHIYQKYQEGNKEIAFPQFATQALGFGHLSDWEFKRQQREGDDSATTYTFYQDDLQDNSLKVQGYDWLSEFSYYRHLKTKVVIEGEQNITILFDNNHFRIESQQKKTESIITIQPSYYAKQLVEQEKGQQRVSAKRLTFVHEDDKIKFKVHFQTIAIQEDGTISDFDAKILFSIKEL